MKSFHLALYVLSVVAISSEFSYHSSPNPDPFRDFRAPASTDSSACLPWQEKFEGDISCEGSSCSTSDLDYYDYVAHRTAATRPDSVASPASDSATENQAVPDPVPEIRIEKVVTEEPKREDIVHQPTSEDAVPSSKDWFDIPSLLFVIFPDPFQAYVFAGLVGWLGVVLLLLAREWRKSSRIVLEVYLHQGTETNPLIEDRLKDQLNLPGEYSLLG